MSIENDAAKGLMDYGAIGIILVISIVVNIKQALGFKGLVESQQKRIDDLNSENLQRISDLHCKHELVIQSYVKEMQEIYLKSLEVIKENTSSINDFKLIIGKRISDLDIHKG